MFKEARVKLTAWYLAIIMTISLSFSVVIYMGINTEFTRIEGFQKIRQERFERINGYLKQNGLPIPPEPQQFNPGLINDSRIRIISTLGIINLAIFGISGLAGYFLAGRTLKPIGKMIDEQKEFVGNASHELRTPLTSLKSEIEVNLRDKKLALSDARKLLASNLEEVDKMQKLSNYLLELNKYEMGRNISMAKVDLKEIALKAIGKRKIKTDLKKSIINGNEDSLVELVAILLDNAFKYSPNGGEVKMTVKNRTIEVSDQGIGIAKEDVPHIFDRFYRAETSRSKQKTDGYGLGLSIAKSIAEVHKGSIKVESKIGKGSTFTVVI